MERLAHKILALNHIVTIERTATTAIKGTARAMTGYRQVMALVKLDAIGADCTCDCKLQQSDTTTDGDFVDITGAAIVQLGASDDNKCAIISARPTKKYVRAVLTPGGTVANGVTAGVVLVLTDPETFPVVNSPAAVVA